MTEYDYSPEAYERYLATQHRIANWVDTTEQHRAEFQSGDQTPPDLSRSGPGSHSQLKKKPSPPPPPRSGHSQPKQLVLHPRPPESESGSSSSDSYYQGPWPAQLPQQRPPMVLPQQPILHPMQQPLSSPPPIMIPPTFIPPPYRVSRHHRHRSHDQRRSRSHQPPAYYSLVPPPLSPGYHYSYSNGYHVLMPQYGGPPVPVMVSQFFQYFSQIPSSPSLFLFLLLCFLFSPIVSPPMLNIFRFSVLSAQFLSTTSSLGTSECDKFQRARPSAILFPTSIRTYSSFTTLFRIPSL